MSSKKLVRRCRQEEEEATALAFQEFLETFQNSSPMSKTFIQAGVYNPGVTSTSCSEAQPGSSSGNGSKIYAPKPLYRNKIGATQSATQAALECARLVKDNTIFKPPMACKPKSNLEALKEELQQRHQPVERLQSQLNTASGSSLAPAKTSPRSTSRKSRDPNLNDIETTTNLFLTNLSYTLTEQDLMQLFGVYGPLASVKIMWPKVATRSRNANYGFVGYMSRKDCKRAFYALGSRTDMKISWGKPIEIPAQPIYIPPQLIKTLLPPPFSGLPFNAQDPDASPRERQEAAHAEPGGGSVDLGATHVKVTIPMDKKVLFAIHRTIEFVVREGPLIEAMIMQKEAHNPVYQFLVDNRSPMHIYYRWKLYSILHGESIGAWRTRPFRMFAGGSIWLPPIVPDYTKGMDGRFVPDEVMKPRARLADAEQRELIQLLQKLTPARAAIANAMVYCVDTMAGARDIVGIIAESFETHASPEQVALACQRRGMKQIARLYLISDVLYHAKFKKCVEFIDLFKDKMLCVFRALCSTIEQYNRRQEARFGSIVKLKILLVLRAWDMWRIFPKDTLMQLEELVQGQSVEAGGDVERKDVLAPAPAPPFVDPQAVAARGAKEATPRRDLYAPVVKSKWETQSPEALQAQAMSTTRLHQIEVQRKCEEELQRQQRPQQVSQDLNYDDLRRIEMKVIRYQDGLESGKRQLRYAHTIEGEVKVYRRRCIEKLSAKRLGQSWNESNSDAKRKCRR